MNKDIRNRKLFVLTLFGFGVIYYLIFPVMLSSIYMSDDLPLSKYLGGLLFNFDYNSYYGYIVAFLIIFILGLNSYLGRVKIEEEYAEREARNDLFIGFVLFAIFIILLINYYLLKDQLFKGYAGLNWNEKNEQKSFISGFNVFLGVFSTYLWKCDSKLKWFSSFITLTNSVILLGLGGRMYVLVVLICILTYLILHLKVSIKKILILSAISFVLLLVMGIVRQGGEINRKGLFFIFIAEPMFNWLSTGSLLKYNHLNYFEIPNILLSSIVSMIPTVVWNGKNEFISQLSGKGSYLIESPVGGTNIIASLISSFGVIGSLISIYVFGFFGGFLIKKSYKNSFCFMSLCAFCALMPFMFFRDNIIIFQKNLLFNGILLPFFIIKCNKVFSRLV
ncbi:O-antigen polymerase [Klebsiella pneumoniae]|uniref:O-antigen polymerase n=1 Tax=Klebsiella pneumoniae TaxID=573 RepID=UPI001F0F627A|nr:O-antigen polymerase [Klebsiella pneumoniae]MDL5529168.1 O-antigen polymerase [Klebsiella pneumoniae]MDL5536285.1 O-antigen polymerase [Klebsiella pneumoniae]UMU85547.1 oligosaccharide repeat unit polymerase [Klebsiella pneumoniae]WJM21600.1 O-antigen polymerase [Klebsiella pneumoniae]WKA19082.1 O-antigen polymerase [Klebsiella pneumoniae]